MVMDDEEDDVAFTPEQLRTELEEVERKLREAKKKREDAERHEQRLEAQRDAYRVLLSEASGSSKAAAVESGSTDGNKVSKTEVIRGIIRESGTRGVSPVDIWRAIQKSGTEMRRNYLYVTLNRLCEQGGVRKHSGKYSMEAVQ